MKIMKILFELKDSHGNNSTSVNYYEVMVMGNKAIVNFYNGYDSKRPEPLCEVVATLTGKLKIDKNNKQFNNLTLVHKTVKFIYDRYNDSEVN
jgi:hypothetical protein